MMKVTLAFAIALSIGALCRFYEIPVPAPPKLLGAMLIVAITVGYLGTDWLMTRSTEPTNGAGTDQIAEPTTGSESTTQRT